MPRPLFTRLIAMSAIGFFCVLFGCSFGIYYHDHLFIVMSLLIDICTVIRVIAFLQMVRKQAYLTLDGTCNAREASVFRREQRIRFTTATGKEYYFTLDKNAKLLQGHHYRLYFRITSPYQNSEHTRPDLLCYEELSSLKDVSAEISL